MTGFRTAPAPVPADDAADRLARLGFLAVADLPDRPGPGLLLVAIRDRPTLRHFDPEAVEHWAAEGGRGVRRRIDRRTELPLDEPFSWGLIRLGDRLHVTNEYVAFGGRVAADRIDDAILVRFVSPAPILRRGGHSQGIDEGATALGGWFGRLRLATTGLPGFEARLAAMEPLGLYAAFLRDELARLSANPTIRATYTDLACLLRAEAERLRLDQPEAWAAGLDLASALDRESEADGRNASG